MSTPDKHTIYIDVDDEITAIIDKVKNAPGKIVAVVLPKRATVLQSIVNMKLLKKSALSAKKNLVLITSEVGLMPLAGAVGLHVAATLQSKPVVPSEPDLDGPDTEAITEALETDEEVDKTKSVGALAAAAEADNADTETIELDDEEAGSAATPAGKKAKKKLKKSFKVPNFDRFRVGIILGSLALILLVVGWVFATIVLPKATVAITTDSSTAASKLDFTANTALQDLDIAKLQVPATQQEVKKTDTEKTPATGKKDNGTKATGTMTLTNCIRDDEAHTIPAGTGFSSGSLTFTTNEEITLPVSTFQGNTCKSANVGDSKDVAVTATKGGADYNVAARSYASTIQGITASGSAMAGGTTVLVTIVSQDDVDTAVAKMKGRLDDAAKKELATSLSKAGLKGIDETLVISAPVVTATPVIGTEATGDVTVTAVTTYNILGVKSSHLSQLVKKDVEGKIDINKQGILDDGLDAAVLNVTNRKSPTEAIITMQAIVTAGPQLNAETIKNEIKGKKKGDVQNIINAKTGVKDVTITYSPFWVYKMPTNVKKITVTIQKPTVTKSASPSTNP